MTNRPCPAPNPDYRSRGLLVEEALAAGSASEAAELLSQLPRRAYNPFNLFVADPDRAFAVVYEQSPDVKELEPGAHVVGNADPDDRNHPKVGRLLERAEAFAAHPRDEALKQLAAICREHGTGGNPLGDPCVHVGSQDGTQAYGTRSSALLVLGGSPVSSHLAFADGPPCKTPYRDFTSLLHEQSRWASYGDGETALRKAN